jgi:arabinose-5-phosphate isomerase
MVSPDIILAISSMCSVSESILEISTNRLGATAVLDNNEQLVGIITDGDVRRMLGKWKQIDELTAGDIMTRNPKTVEADELAVKVFSMMEKNEISQLVVTKNGLYEGMVHVHDMMREGIV